MQELKTRILEHKFISKLRDLNVDVIEYADLCSLLQELEGEWSGKQEIDRELALELYTVVQVARNVLDRQRETGSPKCDSLDDMVQELDALVLACLGA